MHGFMRLKEGISYTLREEGPYFVAKKMSVVIGERLTGMFNLASIHVAHQANNSFFDVIFINGCDYSVPHPIRYRVEHQREQLAAAGISSGFVEASDVDKDLLRHGRVFIIFRCPLTEEIENFIRLAKALNKRVIYDIDDLVIDTKYTDEIPFVAAMDASDKAMYDDGVIRMGQTLKLCDAAITTTEALADELRKYVERVYVNRNTASELMVKYSENAVWRRDVLPKLDPSRLDRHQTKQFNLACQRAERRVKGEIRIGYFSGSITHNADFNLILPALVHLLEARPKVKLVLSGELDLPDELANYSNRIVSVPFCEWKRLPGLIASCDINLAPLTDTLFNRAKSENKWIEASLVKVPTIASNVGAFKQMIENGVTGLLCESASEWYKALVGLVDSPKKRLELAENAYSFCTSECTTVNACQTIAHIVAAEKTPNLAMVFPSLNTSGGVLVAFKHCAILQDAGYDVLLVNTDNSLKWKKYDNHLFPVLNRIVLSGQIDACPFSGSFDKAVATLWDTLDFVKRYPHVDQSYYFIQNFEVGFYEAGDPLKLRANASYINLGDTKCITISKWCEKWLEEKYTEASRYARNGLDYRDFYPIQRDFSHKKIRILIEGDCESKYKNVDESFYITNTLDSSRYEIWYMSYTGKTKPFYRIDRNLGVVPHEEVPDIYRQCHILLKTSLLESFSYPPLEMMSTGGYVVAVPNAGNIEFLEDGKNCLFYEQGNYAAGVSAIERIVRDKNLRKSLYEGGQETAQSRDWSMLTDEILSLYR